MIISHRCIKSWHDIHWFYGAWTTAIQYSVLYICSISDYRTYKQYSVQLLALFFDFLQDFQLQV